MSDKKPEKKKAVTLDDVKPLHPDEYPAQHLKQKLDARRDELADIKEHYPSEGLETSEYTE